MQGVDRTQAIKERTKSSAHSIANRPKPPAASMPHPFSLFFAGKKKKWGEGGQNGRSTSLLVHAILITGWRHTRYCVSRPRRRGRDVVTAPAVYKGNVWVSAGFLSRLFYANGTLRGDFAHRPRGGDSRGERQECARKGASADAFQAAQEKKFKKRSESSKSASHAAALPVSAIKIDRVTYRARCARTGRWITVSQLNWKKKKTGPVLAKQGAINYD